MTNEPHEDSEDTSEPEVPSSEQEVETPIDPTGPAWEFKSKFGINAKLEAVCRKSIDVASVEVDKLKVKLDKLTYGA